MEFVSVRKGSPRDNLTRVAVVYLKEGQVPRLEYKMIAVGKMEKSAPLYRMEPACRGLSLEHTISHKAAVAFLSLTLVQ